MSIKVKINEKAFDFEPDLDPVLKKAAETAKRKMSSSSGLPQRRTNYKGSFFIEHKKVGNETVYKVKNRESWMDAFINNGHIIWNSLSGKRVAGTHHYEKGQKAADNIVLKSNIKLKKK